MKRHKHMAASAVKASRCRVADPVHPFADDLKRKDFFASTRLAPDDVVAHDFVDEYARLCQAAAPLVHLLCDALAVRY